MRVQRVLMPDTVVESWTLLGDDLVPTGPADTSDPADRIDYGPALTWRPTGGHITMTALIGGAIVYMYAYLAARSFYNGFGVPIGEFDLAYRVLVVRAVASLALVLTFLGLLGPLAAVPYDRWLRRHLHRKIPIGRIPGTPLMESVVGFMFVVPLLLTVALFAGLMLGYLALVEFIPPSWVPRGARTAVAWGVLALVALALMALAVWVFARWFARIALHDCLDDRDDAMSPQTRIMGVTLGAALLAGLLAIGATTQGNRAASALRTGKRVADTQRWADEHLLPAVVCVDATWVGPPPAPAGLDHAVLYLGGNNDQVLLYDRQQGHTTWLYAASVTLVHAAC